MAVDRSADLDLLGLFIPAVQDYAVVTLDAEGRVLSWNVGAERTMGYRADEIVGRPFEMLYREGSASAELPAGFGNRGCGVSAVFLAAAAGGCRSRG